MAIAIFRPGRRLFSTAAMLMILTAAAHTAGNLASGPGNPEEQKLFEAMSGYHVAMGMSMNPSVQDIYMALMLTMSITFTALGLVSLVLAGSPEVNDRVLRRVGWVNALWVGAFLVLSWVERVPPPLISAAVIEIFVLAALVFGGREGQSAPV